jgi:uncharacterized protein (DUF362 family)
LKTVGRHRAGFDARKTDLEDKTMSKCSRRDFLLRSAVGSAGVFLPLRVLAEEGKAPAAKKSVLAVARRPETAFESVDPDAGAPALVEAAVEALGGISKFVSPGDVVWVKPNIGWDRRPEQAADTNPRVVAALVKMCRDAGAKKIRVTDHPCNDPRRTFTNSGVREAAEEAGADVFMMDSGRFRDVDVGGEALHTWPLYAEALDADKIVNVAIAKHHSLAGLTLSMKNLMGLVGGSRNQMHQNLGPSLADLTAYFKPTLSIVDGVRILLRNGPVGGKLEDVERKDTVIASVDPVAVDSYSATLFGKTARDVAGVREAAQRGLGEMDLDRVDIIRKEVA